MAALVALSVELRQSGSFQGGSWEEEKGRDEHGGDDLDAARGDGE
jgi:hypothetical protein